MADIAVLTRNFGKHLQKAVDSCAPITFFSNVRWASVDRAHTDKKVVKVYFVPEDAVGVVTYAGILHSIALNAAVNAPATKKFLDYAPDDAAENGVRDGTAKTIYTVEKVSKLSHGERFPQTELFKVDGGKRVSAAYDRSYCIVHPRD